MHGSAAQPIDTRHLDFLSYPPPGRGNRPELEEVRVSVEPEAGERRADELFLATPCFPLRIGKVQRPLLPDETVRRDRLLNWLQARIRRRVIFLIAEAGFGKTTLAADFVRHSRIRSFWYRLDEDDTDGLVFLRYLVASCRAVDPALLPRAAALLAEPALEPTHQARVADALFEELEALGEVPSAIVLDDFHMAEAVPSIRALVERLIERAPSGLALIFMSRRMPALSVAALRSRGQIAELGRDQLRFDEAETGRMFCQSSHPLEPDVLHDLHARTEGWAASLQLVKAAVEGRSMSQVRAFVRSLSGAAGDLYDYLAEEVVGELPPELRGFLIRITLLEEVELETAGVASGVPLEEARHLLVEAQRMGLLSKSNGADSSWRLHPLVREFLLSHLVAEVGESGVANLHRQLAASLEQTSWRLAASHWAAAGDAADVRRVICSALPTIIATGDLAAAEDLIARFPDPDPNPWFEIIRSRGLASAGRHSEALQVTLGAAELAAALPEDPILARLNALTLMSLGLMAADLPTHSLGRDQLIGCGDPELAAIARSGDLMWQASESGSLDSFCSALTDAAKLSHDRQHHRHEGITLLNLTLAEVARGNHTAAAGIGVEAIRILATAGDCGDLAAARVNTARAVAHVDRLSAWSCYVEAVLTERDGWIELPTIAEIAELHVMYGDPAKAIPIMANLVSRDSHWAQDPYCRQVEARVEMVRGDLARAARLLSDHPACPSAPSFRSASFALEAQILACQDPQSPRLMETLAEGIESSEAQQAWLWHKAMCLTRALVSSGVDLAAHFQSLTEADWAHLSIQAELVITRLHHLDVASLAVVRREAALRPERWRWALRRQLASSIVEPTLIRCSADLLETIGTTDDLKLLRSIARNKRLRMPDLGRALLRRLAPAAFVEDLGRVMIQVGERVVMGTEVRKKSLSLLVFLLTRPQFTASREQVMDALWPDMEPEAAGNSLNQTSYFLRQVFEPRSDDDASAGYLTSRGDLIWLDPLLVQSRSQGCWKLIASMRHDPSPALVAELAEAYTGRFATDFMYDDWASSYRETLHATFLDRVERAIVADTRAGAFDRAVTIAQLALHSAPDAEEIELSLLHLYRLTGAHAAAAELYAHYASVLREQLGVEPPPLDTI